MVGRFCCHPDRSGIKSLLDDEIAVAKSRSTQPRIGEMLRHIWPPTVETSLAENVGGGTGHDAADVDCLARDARPTCEADAVDKVFTTYDIIQCQIGARQGFDGVA